MTLISIAPANRKLVGGGFAVLIGPPPPPPPAPAPPQPRYPIIVQEQWGHPKREWKLSPDHLSTIRGGIFCSVRPLYLLNVLTTGPRRPSGQTYDFVEEGQASMYGAFGLGDMFF